jgi:hypothetical protein
VSFDRTDREVQSLYYSIGILIYGGVMFVRSIAQTTSHVNLDREFVEMSLSIDYLNLWCEVVSRLQD